MHCWLEHAEKLPSKNCLEQVSIRQQDRAVAGCPIQSDSSKQYSRRVEWSQLDRVMCFFYAVLQNSSQRRRQ